MDTYFKVLFLYSLRWTKRNYRKSVRRTGVPTAIRNRYFQNTKTKKLTIQTGSSVIEMDITACTLSVIGPQKEFQTRKSTLVFIRLTKDRQNRTELTLVNEPECPKPLIPKARH
jgi:hypothetical protein